MLKNGLQGPNSPEFHESADDYHEDHLYEQPLSYSPGGFCHPCGLPIACVQIGLTTGAALWSCFSHIFHGSSQSNVWSNVAIHNSNTANRLIAHGNQNLIWATKFQFTIDQLDHNYFQTVCTCHPLPNVYSHISQILKWQSQPIILHVHLNATKMNKFN